METTGETQQRSVDGRSKKKRVVVRSSTGLEDDFMQSDFSSLNDISGDSNTGSSSILNGQNRPNSLDDDDAKEEILLPVEIEENIIKLQLIDLFRGLSNYVFIFLKTSLPI
ncbi:uncharacterized protein TRIADDRAFT_51849 [Trichoplax adhaerens]|uniref:Uncharacterized protein n=1 Tax=Trichoplax adhaerens TaxID=10228 RepID=B3RL21_TRIAD|nr:predicted protein [Trichoplax adhaerens]EDV29473.1 predicted protein [Trichoplax adhaerens]|eukprot:XP_002108675.1 predicted protein [Trichoplax adhaerens]